MCMTRPIQVLFALFAAVILSGPAGAGDWNTLRPLITDAKPIGDQPSTTIPEKGPIIVTFFASWCPPCTDEFAHLNDIANDGNYEGTTIIAVNVFEDFGGVKKPERMTRFLNNTKPEFALIEGNERIKEAFGKVDRIPTVVIYGSSGEEIWRFVHKRNAVKTHATAQDVRTALDRDRSF